MATIEPPVATKRLRVEVVRRRGLDYLELTKPRIATMALITVAVGYALGAAPNIEIVTLLNTLLGAGLVAAGGSALNHRIEHRADAQMWRTANRPLAANRLSLFEVGMIGVTLSLLGVGYLFVMLTTPGAAIAAALTCILYVAVYTPLKQITTWNTIIGAIPGALPPLIGWCAARPLSAEGFVLFGILFVWQLPHFYSISWMHGEDYARGGMRMLPVVDHADGRWTGIATVVTCGLLVLATLAPLPFLDLVSAIVYAAGALPLAIWFFLRSLRFAKQRTHTRARTVLRGSLVYLVGVMGLLLATGVLPRYLGS